jgi:hypothetical protein
MQRVSQICKSLHFMHQPWPLTCLKMKGLPRTVGAATRAANEEREVREVKIAA